MRKMIIAGNWKMNMELLSARDLVRDIRSGLEQSGALERVDVVLCPPYPFLAQTSDGTAGTAIGVGAQNIHQAESGAYTGEVSAEMLLSAGCTHVIIGHSERRQYFGESDDLVNAKLRRALDAELNPIVCIGETLEERDAGTTMEVVSSQVRGALQGVSAEQMERVVLAYEPVWAIGTGRNATPEQAQEVHATIRALISELYGSETADALRIQYGGSMKPGNAGDLLRQPDVDGGLIGGASLNSADFLAIVTAAEQAQTL